MLRVATIAALGVATANAAAISETYPLTADCQVRSRRVQRARFSVRGKRPTSSFVATAAHGDASRELVVRTAQSPSRRSKSRSTRRSTRPSRVAVGSPSFLPTPKRPNADALFPSFPPIPRTSATPSTPPRAPIPRLWCAALRTARTSAVSPSAITPRWQT